MISLLVVNYKTAALAMQAIRSARAATRSPLQVVAVDNSCDPFQAEELRGAADVVIASATNRGYAGGINDGRRVCEGGVIVVSNPDVVFAPNAIDQLAAALDRHTAVAGPALFWDDAHKWMLPPADRNTTLEKLDEVLASRARSWFELRDRRRFRKRVVFWSLDRTTPVDALSGAVMAIRAEDFDAIGGFDERFGLYFEEIDFLRRIAERRRRIVYVPAARCRHLYNQSAGLDSAAAAAAYARSELQYLEKWSGPFMARLLKRLERAPLPSQVKWTEGPIEVDRENVVVEVSPMPSFATAAGHFPRTTRVEVPPEVWAVATTDVLYLRVVEKRSGDVLAAYGMSRITT